MKSRSFFVSLGGLLLLPACSSSQPDVENDSPISNQSDDANGFDRAITYDWEKGWKMAPEEVEQLENQGEAGDFESMRMAFEYFSVMGPETRAAYWHKRLLDAGDTSAINLEVENLLNSARSKMHSDPGRLIQLMRAEELLISLGPNKNKSMLAEVRSEIEEARSPI